MRCSTKTLYGLRFLLRLALLPAESRLCLGQMAAEENIPAGYLEQIARILKSGGIVTASRGAHGGYRLALPAAEINLEQVFSLLEGRLAPADCLLSECGHQNRCCTRDFWLELDAHIRDFLRLRTLAELADKCRIENGDCITEVCE